jgi:hypothetical protein
MPLRRMALFDLRGNPRSGDFATPTFAARSDGQSRQTSY